jgi:hypothetical protein
VTIWPWRTKSGRANDMLMILGALVERKAPGDAHAAGWAWALFEHGVEPDAWPPWLREHAPNIAQSPWAPPYAAVLAFVCALDDGDAGRARDVAAHAPHDAGKVLRGFAAAWFDNDVAIADTALASLNAEPDSDTLHWLRALALARILKLNGEAAAAERAYDQLAQAINASGAPQPFWQALLAHARRDALTERG